MAKTKSAIGSYFFFVCIFAVMFWNNTHGSVEDGFIVDYSKKFLPAVPKKIPVQITTLDLSYNNITELCTSDFSSLSKLQRLIMTHNHVANLDLSVFKNNRDLEYLDLSHNSLGTISCYIIGSLKHLDLSYNRFVTMPTCHELLQMTKLKFLSFGMKRIQSADLNFLEHLYLDTLFLNLEDLSEYSSGNLTLNTRNLQMLLPKTAEVPVLSYLVLNGIENLVLSNIQSAQNLHDLITFLSKLKKNENLLNLTLSNLQTSWNNLIDIIQEAWEARINYFSIYHVTISHFERDPKNLNYVNTSLRSVTFKNIILVEKSFNQKTVYETLAEMNIPALTVSDAGMVYMVCPTKPSNFTYLNFSNNALTDVLFEKCDNLRHVESLILKDNLFKQLTKVSLMTNTMRSLKYLDMSQNLLQYEDNGNDCDWSKNIAELNLSFNVLSKSVFKCLPVNIQKLYLQNNQISRIPEMVIELNYLEELNLASNKLTKLPGCIYFRRLRLLNVEMNSILSASDEFFQSCRSIQRLNGGSNPFVCSCELRQLINREIQGYVEFVDWPDSYTCQYPNDLRGTLLKDFRISEVVCNVTLLITVVLIVTVVFGATVSFLCIRFDVPWYLKMMWNWTRVKHRIWKSKPEDVLDNICFHAFVSYSEHDSEWVKNVLIRNLEKEDGSIWICQHERNFIAGKSIVENIIDCIEKSYKSIFVLSPNFVQSEWCHYELYFAHHKLFSENADSLILVLLDTIPTYTIPSKYHMLKSLMARRTYLEWPKEKSKQGLFWANLRAAIQIKLPNNQKMNELEMALDIEDGCLL